MLALTARKRANSVYVYYFTWAFFIGAIKLLRLNRTIDKVRNYDSHPELPLDPDVVQPGEYKWPLHLTPALQLAVFLGGCGGTLARYGVSERIPETIAIWPVATFLINITGAFMLGFLLEALARRGKDKGKLRIIRLGVGTGFIGAFTTYSALAVETDLLVRADYLGVAIAYAFASVVVGIIFAVIGIQLASAHHKRKKVRS